jgi:hypothetical protein
MAVREGRAGSESARIKRSRIHQFPNERAMMVVALGHKIEMVHTSDRRLQARVGNGARPWPCVQFVLTLSRSLSCRAELSQDLVQGVRVMVCFVDFRLVKSAPVSLHLPFL